MRRFPHPRHGDAFVAFGRAVRETRVRRDYSQESLGVSADLHRNYVGAIERGEINPTLRVIRKLARALAMQESELLALAEARERELQLGAQGRARGGGAGARAALSRRPPPTAAAPPRSARTLPGQAPRRADVD